MAGRENILMGVSYLHPIFSANFSASAICLILRSCGSGVGGGANGGPTPRSTSHPTMQLFLQVHSARCN